MSTEEESTVVAQVGGVPFTIYFGKTLQDYKFSYNGVEIELEPEDVEKLAVATSSLIATVCTLANPNISEALSSLFPADQD